MSKKYKRQWRKNLILEKEILAGSLSSTSDDDHAVASVTQTEKLDYGDIVFDAAIGRDGTDSTNASFSDLSLESSDLSLEFTDSMNSSSDNLSGNDVPEQPLEDTFAKELSAWACRNRCTQTAINEILCILRANSHPDLPKDARTLLKTPRSVSIQNKCGGEYAYLGLEKGLLRQLSYLSNSIEDIQLNVNVDGVPLFKSSCTSLWPVLAKFKLCDPFLVAVFCGQSKPSDCHEFMSDFLDEYKKLEANGIIHGQVHISVNIKSVLCDAPARQFMKCIKSHNAYYGCERCQVKGELVEHRMVYHAIDAPPRNHTEFNALVYDHHQKAESPFVGSSISCINDFVLDYMHLVCLGVTRRLLLFLKEGPRICRLSRLQISQISDRLEAFTGKIPGELARQPRSLHELKRWKATEFRQFLIYTGPVALRGILSENYYVHFLSLSVAIRIMLESDEGHRNKYLNFAQELLQYFVRKSSQLYGLTFCTYNTHSLIHLHEDVQHFNSSLDEISCFPFENYLQVLKKFVRKAQNPIAQVIKRDVELQNASVVRRSEKRYTRVSCSEKDCWFLLSSGKLACVKEKRYENKLVCEVVNSSCLDNYYAKPCNSQLVKVFLVRRTNIRTKVKLLDKEELKRKVVCLPSNNGIVLTCLLHDATWN